MKNLLLPPIVLLFAIGTTTCDLPRIADRNPPQASFTIQNNRCTAPCEVFFSSTSKNSEEFSWEFGDGNKGSGEMESNVYDQEGIYPVTLIVSASDPSTTQRDTVENEVIILKGETTALFSAEPTVCEAPCEVTITNKSVNATSFAWNFGDNSVGNDTRSSFTHTYTNEGSYNINMTATGPGGSDEADPVTINVTAPAIPIASFEIDSVNHNSFAPATVIFRNTSMNANSYRWEFDDPSSGSDNTSNEANPTHLFKGSGNYNVKLIAENTNNNLESTPFEFEIEIKNPITFTKAIDGGGMDGGYAITQAANGGYAMTGRILWPGAMGQDLWVLITNATGAPIANKAYHGGDGSDFGNDIIRTSNGGYAITGYAHTTNKDDLWLLITNSSGDTVMTKKYDSGSGQKDRGRSIIQNSSGGFAITGYFTDKNGTNNADLWLLITDANGDSLIDKRYTNGENAIGHAIVQLSNGGYAIAGETENFGNIDGLLLIMDANGNILNNNKTFSHGTNTDRLFSIVQMKNGDLAMVGESYNGNNYDLWLLVTDSNGNPYPSKNKNLSNILDAVSEDELGNEIIQTQAGGFAITGGLYDGADGKVLLLVTDANGNKILEKSFDEGLSGQGIIQTEDGGFVITAPENALSNSDLVLIKTDADGNAN